ncbi:hypothetical protein PAXINDRAFT_100625 [Paxillus involutus ATCC 200175]|uniref:Uncharacterized protein n=1 Tax=Paxillus involutus ATCC 200175 TaxID=664439 RepID=A0A0C9U1F9_PAXIN|nr:hypothetical protein PAXINDRAFT_100625 [Paxillus involutus ATCC 200175]
MYLCQVLWHPDIFPDEVEHREKEKAEAEKQAKRKADGEVRVAQIERDIRDKVFDAPLSSFRRKDEYITLAGALGISQDGTVEELKTRIKNYIADPTHAADIAQNPRFSGLFLAVGKSRTKNPTAPDRPDHTHHVDFGISQSSATHQPYRQHGLHGFSHLQHDLYHGTYHDTYHSTYPGDPSSIASSSNLDRQPHFVNAGIDHSRPTPSTYYYSYPNTS